MCIRDNVKLLNISCFFYNYKIMINYILIMPNILSIFFYNLQNFQDSILNQYVNKLYYSSRLKNKYYKNVLFK